MAAARKLKNLRSPVWRRPDKIAKAYDKALQAAFNKFSKAVVAVINKQLPAILKEARDIKGQTTVVVGDSLRNDSIAEKLETLSNDLYIIAGNTVQSIDYSSFAEDANDFNKKQRNAIIRKVVGVDVYTAEPWNADMLSVWTLNNATLVKNAAENAVNQIQTTIAQGARQGLSPRALAKQLEERLGVSKSRAKLIARDQLSKLNAQLTEQRQTDLGITEYIWRTAGDGRVREEHEVRDGKTYKWSDPPEDGHPGEPINCRCYADPVIPDNLLGR